MNQMQTPIDVRQLECLIMLEKHLNSVVSEVASGTQNGDSVWEYIEGPNYEIFTKDIKAIAEDNKYQIYQALLSILFRWIVKFEEMRGCLEEGWEFSLCREAELSVFKYVAVVVGHTLFDAPDNCAYQIVKDVQLLPITYSREQVLLLTMRHFDFTEVEARRLKMDQCNKCLKRNCDGRYSDVLCGQAEWLHTNCDDLIFRKGHLQLHDELRASISIHNTNYIFNENTQNNYSIIQQNFQSEQVIMIDETERENVLRDMSQKQRERMNKCMSKLKEEGICDEDGRFSNQKLQELLVPYGADALINGQAVDGALKGLFADAVRKEIGLNNSWKEIQAIFKEEGFSTRLSRAFNYRDSARKREKGVFRCLVEIVQAIFPKYLP